MMRRVLIFTLVAAFAFGDGFAQQTVTYTNGENDTSTIALTALTNPTTLTITSGTATQSGAISESGTAGAINLTGGGTLILTGANTYTGGTTISGGILQVASESNLGGYDLGGEGLGGVTLGGGELLTTTTGTLTQGVTLNGGNNTLAASNGTTETYSYYTITGSTGSLTIGDGTNVGTVILPNANSYGGGTTVASGVLEVNNGGALGTGTVTVQSGATLSLYGYGAESGGPFNVVDVDNNITISGTGSTGQGALLGTGEGGSQSEAVTGTVTLAADATVEGPAPVGNSISPFDFGPIDLSSHTLTLGSGNTAFDLTGTITGSGGITMDAIVVSIVGGNNTFTGNTDVLSGTQLEFDDTAGTAISGNLTIENGAFILDDLGNQLTANSVITLNGNGRFQLVLRSVSPIAETAAGLQGTSATSLVEASVFETDPFDGSSATLTLAGGGNYAYAGQITDFSYGSPPIVLNLIKQGLGTQILSGNNTYAGTTVVNGGILIFTQSQTNSSAISIAKSATLNLAKGNFTTAGTITNNGTLILGNGVTLSSTGAFTNNGTIKIFNDPSFTLPSNFVNYGTVLTASTPPQTLAEWEADYPSLTDLSPSDTPMKDGVPTLLKYLYDINPSQAMAASDWAALPAYSVASSGDLTLTFRKNFFETGIMINVQTSQDLQNWTTVPQVATPTAGSYTFQPTGTTDETTGDPYMKVDFKPASPLPRQFIRLNVMMP